MSAMERLTEKGYAVSEPIEVFQVADGLINSEHTILGARHFSVECETIWGKAVSMQSVSGHQMADNEVEIMGMIRERGADELLRLIEGRESDK